jgi:hypothetical protein
MTFSPDWISIALGIAATLASRYMGLKIPGIDKPVSDCLQFLQQVKAGSKTLTPEDKVALSQIASLVTEVNK